VLSRSGKASPGAPETIDNPHARNGDRITTCGRLSIAYFGNARSTLTGEHLAAYVRT